MNRFIIPSTRVAAQSVVLISLLVGAGLPRGWAQNSPAAHALFGQENLVAWCVVPFDAKKRGPAERAAMLKKLGFNKLAYDWRQEHVPTFEEEILELKRQGIEFFSFWSVHEEAFKLFKKHGIKPQVWITVSSPNLPTQDAKIEAAARQLLPHVKRTRELGVPLGLYNHGGWGGEPKNLAAVCQWLRDHDHGTHVGIVYNLHHGHGHITDFAESLAAMKPYLLCLNLNGMNDGAKPKILPVGQGQHDQRMLKTILHSGYRGPIGILDHRSDLDAEESLRLNLEGLRRLVPELESGSRLK